MGVRATTEPGRGAALDFYTNKSAEPRSRLACEKPRIGLRLRSSTGSWAPVRCGLNSCRGCYGMKSLLRAQMVYEDALVEQPRYSITLTTKAPTWDGDRYRDGKAQVLRALRARFGRVEMLEFIEQTTGKAPRSGGHRRGHGHNLVKLDEPGAVLDIEALVGPIWKRVLGASQVSVSELQSAGGAVAYLTLNLALEKGKSSQAPVDLPKGTRTLRGTRGYWSVPAAELKDRARDHHAARRLRHALMVKLDDGSGVVNGDLLDLWFEHEWELHKATTWELWQVYEHPDAVALFEPIGVVEKACPRETLPPVGADVTTGPISSAGVPTPAARLAGKGVGASAAWVSM